jgi:hypothetical protein
VAQAGARGYGEHLGGRDSWLFELCLLASLFKKQANRLFRIHLEKRRLESGRGTRPARAAAARISAAETAGWPRRARHARRSGDSAAAGKPPPPAGRSGMSTVTSP